MGVCESTDLDAAESLWWRACPECGTEVEGETLEEARAIRR